MEGGDVFNQAILASLGSFQTVGTYGNVNELPFTFDDVLSLTVGNYRQFIAASFEAIANLDTSLFQVLLDDAEFNEGIDEETRGFFESIASGDVSVLRAPLEEALAIFSEYSDDITLLMVIEGTTGNGDLLATIEQAFVDAQTELSEFLWDFQSNVFTSPVFSVDALTGDWFAQNGTAQGAYSGQSLEQLFDRLGDAVSDAITSFLGADQNVFTNLVDQDTSTAEFEAAQSAASASAAEAFAALQELAEEAFQPSGGVTLDDVSAEIAAFKFQSIFNAFVDILAGDKSAFEAFKLGSRNSDPQFIVSLEGDLNGSAEGDWFYLSQLGDIFNGGLGSDLLFGLDGNDILTGGADFDQLFGGIGDDVLTGGLGDDGISGGDGVDIASFATTLGQFTLQFFGDGSVTTQDRSASGEGTDILTGIEMLSFGSGASIFTDGMVDLGQFQAIASLSEEQIDTFVELYIAYFNRAPDAIGLNFWGSAFANGTSLSEIASLFLDQDETRATYPSDTTSLEFATQVYENVLGRIPDAAGLTFWQDQLDSGNVDRGTFILEVLAGTRVDLALPATAEDIALQLADRSYLETKTDIGSYFSVIRGLSDVEDASSAMQLFERGSESSISDALAFIEAEYASAIADGSGEVLMQLVGVADNPFAG